MTQMDNDKLTQTTIKRAIGQWRQKRRLHRISDWIFAPVFLVSQSSLILGIHFSSLGNNFVEQDFWQATKQTVMLVIQSFGLS